MERRWAEKRPRRTIPLRVAEELPGGDETILLVDDEDGIRKLARSVLEKVGYTVLEAAEGSSALTLCERHSGPIHLMLTDVMMPHMNGIELRESLATLLPEMRVLFMSGYADRSQVKEDVLARARSFLPKPFTPEDLARSVRETLDRAPDADDDASPSPA